MARVAALLGLLVMWTPLPLTVAGTAGKNSWRGITPLHSSAQDVARLIGVEADSSEALLSGPFKVDGGEVTFSLANKKAHRTGRLFY